jgi:tetratricopeptide (TPR) repeat protein
MIDKHPKHPGPAGLYLIRGQVYANRKQWEKAAADFAHAKAINPPGGSALFWHALIRLALCDHPGYRSDCAEAVRQYSVTADPNAARGVAWTCALAPGAVDDWKAPVRLAEQASRANPKNPTFSTTLGAVLYRAGRSEEAIQPLENATKMFERPGTDCVSASPVCAWLFLALAHHRRGHAEEARRCFNKASELADREMNNQVMFDRKLAVELLRREATAAIGPTDKK